MPPINKKKEKYEKENPFMLHGKTGAHLAKEEYGIDDIDILDSIKVSKLYVNTLEHDSKMAKAIFAKAKEVGTEIVLVSEENTITFSNLILKNYLPKNAKDDPKNAGLLNLVNNKYTIVPTPAPNNAAVADIP